MVRLLLVPAHPQIKAQGAARRLRVTFVGVDAMICHWRLRVSARQQTWAGRHEQGDSGRWNLGSRVRCDFSLGACRDRVTAKGKGLRES